MKWTNKKCRDAVIAAPLHFAIYSYVLCKELVINTEYKDKQNYCRQYICKIRFHPVVHLESLAGVCLCLEIAPAPAVSCNTESRYTSEPRGRNILLTRKSSTSRTAPPKISKPLQLQILYPSTQGSESAVMSTRFTSPVFFLLHPVSSIPQHMMFSKTARTVESAANDINMKKRFPHNLPRCIFANMLGRVMNIRLGPDVCSVLHNTLLEFFCAYSIDFFHIIYFQQLIFGCRNCKAVDF